MATAKRITPDPVPDTIQLTLTDDEAQFLATLLMNYYFGSAYHGPTADTISSALQRHVAVDVRVTPRIHSELFTFDRED